LEAFSACFQTGQFDPVLTFYDISPPGLHLPGTGKKRGVAQRRQLAAGNVTLSGDLQSATGRISSACEIFFLF
jgi:hypothetical protein